MNTLFGIVLFSIIESAVVILWASLVFKSEVFTGQQVLGAIVFVIGYTIEHIVAYNVGKGRPFFSWPKP